ncbi:MAG: carbohydrate kinase family protein [Thermoplasmata archaeon]|uniref:Carbohydrate kinase family protein n=1 Tax=Candidatus Sysuiplasma superficiale TaxID=2823368 RepID=A0A8J8CFE0_9ARCH|nr:carbohydrate kinase family protein [Candidatus Sysuiplasma superficiale]MBX8643316.1 carbohydrate kinase family protein [Candidatus Sysuiplasma superficiale]MCL5437305.1 carbohydrate kinase family protein [Candidatus Thermoplasmatota archaeon]
MRKEIDLLLVGDAVLDIYFRIDSFPLSSEVVESSPTLDIIPGAMCTVAITSSRMGLRTALLDTVGCDCNGSLLLDSLKNEGVETGYVRRSAKCRTSVCAVIVANSHRHSFIGWSDPINHIAHATRRSIISRARMLFFDGYTLASGAGTLKSMRKVLDICSSENVTVAFDPGPLIADIPSPDVFCVASDIIFLNSEEKRIFDRMVQKRRLDFSDKLIVEKMGALGSRCHNAGQTIHSRGVRLDRIDNTVGAGDVFDAVFLWALFMGLDVRSCLDAANFAAAKRVSSGAISGIVSRNEVLGYINVHKQRVI